jgi:A/G-specific adenine glycosylase
MESFVGPLCDEVVEGVVPHAPESAEVAKFQAAIYGYYRSHGRKMPWRETSDPYSILVSEVMLQQTQVSRVAEKFTEFIAAFPDMATLHRASLQEVLAVWRGLGYNRRALALKTIAKQVVEELGGVLPPSLVDLMRLKGVGGSTAGAIMAFAFNQPVVFIETNIRTVFIHFFFPHELLVKDAKILPLIEEALDRENPRIWYWALMDYGAMLKKEGLDMNKRSAHHQTQTRFHGSLRQVRGSILKAVVQSPGLTDAELARETGFPPERIREGIEGLKSDGFIVCETGRYRVSG